jgi:hypothetical protein
MEVTIAGCPPGLAPVSLVFTVCNSAADLPDLLESIARQQLLPSELLIVDLGSTDGTLEVLRTWQPPASTLFKVIESPGASIAQGRNLAIEKASFGHIAVTHGAVRLHTEWLSRLWLALSDGADLVSGDIRPAGKTLLERTIGLLETQPVNEIDPTSYLPPSVSLAFSKGMWDAVGGYPEWLAAGQDAVFAAAMRHAGAAFSLASGARAAWSPRQTLRGYLASSFRNSRAEGEAEIVEGGQSVRAALDVTALIALLLRRSGPARSLAAVALSIRLGSLIRRIWQTRKISDDPIVLRVATAGVLLAAGDVAKLAGYAVGWADNVGPDEDLALRPDAQPLISAGFGQA